MIRGITLILIIGVVGLTSCNKETIIEPTNSTIIQRAFSPIHKVLFHYYEVSEAEQILKGWIVDNTGEVRVYDLSNEAGDPDLPTLDKVDEELLYNLYSVTTAIDVQIDLSELKQKYLTLERISSGEVTTYDAGIEGEVTTYLIGYNQTNESAPCDGSGNCGNDSMKEEVLVVELLEAFGEVNRKNTLQGAEWLADWMKGIKTEQNL